MLKRQYSISFGRTESQSIDYIMGLLEDARITTIQVIDKLPDAALDWQYKEGWNTIGALLDHISAIEHFFRIEYVEERKLTDEENARLLPALDMGVYLPQLIQGKTIDSYKVGLSESRQMLNHALQHISFKDFIRKREGYDPVDGCNLAWVLYHMMEDEIYHRGQISMLKKLYAEKCP